MKLDAATLKSKSSLLLARPNINPLKKSPLPAFAMKSSINWTGFVYTWSLHPNEKLLIEKGVPLSYLSAFRNYLK